MGANSELYIELQDGLFNMMEKVESGELSHLDGLIYAEQQRRELEQLLDVVKDYKNQKIQEIENEAMDYPEGYKGYKVEVRAGRKMYSFKNIDSWNAKKKELKELEDTAKQAFAMRQKGILMADENGEEIQLPELSIGKGSIVIKKV